VNEAPSVPANRVICPNEGSTNTFNVDHAAMTFVHSVATRHATPRGLIGRPMLRPFANGMEHNGEIRSCP
jgi:hypothetical protein